MSSEKGIKNDGEKTRLDLLSSRWVYGVGQVLTFGAKKYAAHNWRKGIERSRLLGAALRHIFAYLGGEDFDPETGLLHLYHASCCLMFASEMHETRVDLDDRYKNNDEECVLYVPNSTIVGVAQETLAKGDLLNFDPSTGKVTKAKVHHSYTSSTKPIVPATAQFNGA